MTDTELRRLAESIRSLGGTYCGFDVDVVIGLLDRCERAEQTVREDSVTLETMLAEKHALEDRIKALEVERDEIAAVHAELRALFPERPIVNMIDAVREALDRPAISPRDAALLCGSESAGVFRWSGSAVDARAAKERVENALRAHAAKGGE